MLLFLEISLGCPLWGRVMQCSWMQVSPWRTLSGGFPVGTCECTVFPMTRLFPNALSSSFFSAVPSNFLKNIKTLFPVACLQSITDLSGGRMGGEGGLFAKGFKGKNKRGGKSPWLPTQDTSLKHFSHGQYICSNRDLGWKRKTAGETGYWKNDCIYWYLENLKFIGLHFRIQLDHTIICHSDLSLTQTSHLAFPS